MKKFLLFSATALLCSISCSAAIDYTTSGIGLEIQNKARRPLWIALINGNTVYQPVHIKELNVKGLNKLAPAVSSISQKIDITKPTKVAIWYRDPGKIEYGKTKLGGLVGKENFMPAPSKIYSFTPRKTIYLTWDNADFPRPQTGKYGGITGETNSGLSLSNNVEPHDIKEESLN